MRNHISSIIERGATGNDDDGDGDGDGVSNVNGDIFFRCFPLNDFENENENESENRNDKTIEIYTGRVSEFGRSQEV